MIRWARYGRCPVCFRTYDCARWRTGLNGLSIYGKENKRPHRGRRQRTSTVNANGGRVAYGAQ